MQLVVSIFPLLFLAASVLAACPPEQSVSPCECDEEEDDGVDLICSGQSITLDQVKRALSAVDRSHPITLLFDDMSLGSIPSDFFQGFNIRKLEISHCELDSLSGGGGKPLTGLEDTLVELEIMTSFTESSGATKLELGHLKRLEEIDIAYNAISELTNYWFAGGPASLNRLLFSNNHIKNVDDRAFANLNNLNSFHFDGNRFGHLKRSMLPNPATKLEEMELDNNDFTSVPDDMFVNMPALRKLSLRTNRITNLPEQTFKAIWGQMDVIDLRGNPIKCDSHLDWISKTKSEAAVFGRCDAPADQRGVELRDFLSGR